MWQRSQPDLHDLADGRPVRQPHAKQARRREDWATLAAMVAHGGDRTAGRLWLARPQHELGAALRDMAAEDWRGLVRVPRLLEEGWPGCTA